VRSPAALGGLGRLELAARRGDGLVYVGGVGTGFTIRTASDLLKQLPPLIVSKPPIRCRDPNLIWVKPQLIAEIEFRGWTEDKILRQASFKGLRDKEDEATNLGSIET
jgi:bifunctional non-homologous end joining protein LigD